MELKTPHPLSLPAQRPEGAAYASVAKSRTGPAALPTEGPGVSPTRQDIAISASATEPLRVHVLQMDRAAPTTNRHTHQIQTVGPARPPVNLPPQIQRALGRSCVLINTHTQGGGACALHAAFGWRQAGDTIAAGLRCRQRAAHTTTTLVTALRQRTRPAPQRLQTMCTAWWGALCDVAAGNPSRDAVCNLLWDALQPESRAATRGVWNKHARAVRRHCQTQVCFDTRAREVVRVMSRKWGILKGMHRRRGGKLVFADAAWR